MSDNNKVEDFEYGIELNDDQVSSLFKPSDSPTMSFQTEPKNPVVDTESKGQEESPEVEETQATEQPTSTEEQTPKEEVNTFTHNGQEYSDDDLRLALEALNNKSEWQKANTQKAQELSDDRKAFVSMRDRLNTLLDNEVRSELGDDHKLFELLKEAESLQEEVADNKSIAEPEAEVSRIGELESKILKMETEKQVDRDIEYLVESHPELRNNPNAINEVLNVALEKRLNLEDAFIFANATANGESKLLEAIKQVEKANELKKQAEVTTTTKGVREEPTPRGETYDDIASIALSKYNLM